MEPAPISIEPVTVYRLTHSHGLTEDFSTMEQAERRRARIEAIQRANAVLDAGGTLLDAHKAAGDMLWIDLPAELHAVTKKHGFRISHWQCSDLHAYSVHSITLDGGIDVYGRGGWSGVYGHSLSPRDLARHAHKPEIEEWKDPFARTGS